MENSLDETDGLRVGGLNNIPPASPRTMGCSQPVTLGEEASEEDREVIPGHKSPIFSQSTNAPPLQRAQGRRGSASSVDSAVSGSTSISFASNSNASSGFITRTEEFGSLKLPISDYSEAHSSGYFSSRCDGVSVTDSSARDDDSSSDDSDWDEDEWPAHHPLVLPLYGCERPELEFSCERDLRTFLVPVRQQLQDCLQALPYDTVSTFLQFCQEFNKNRSDYSSLSEFFRDYDIPVLPGRYTCVGLSSDLLSKLAHLESSYPGLKDSMYQVSCEEDIERLDWYCSNSTPPLFPSEKEHVLVCVRLRVAGRPGVVLMDPGYHVSEPMVVMEDGLSPHAATHVAKCGTTTKTNTYEIYEHNPSYVVWRSSKETPLGTSKCVNVVHVSHPFLSGLDVAERRNLVYGMKTLINRARNGEIRSSFYFTLQPIRTAKLTLFFSDDDGEQFRVKVPFTKFLDGPNSVGHNTGLERWSPALKCAWTCGEEDLWREALARVARDSGRGREIIDILPQIASLLADNNLLDQLLEINAAIESMSKDN
ncbi:uncharacterized protein LOC108665911 [Hyalella azteca]|uniref:Uncharacterized protein LOC108665911 n=1 Tax=Hyalella azteca TaxID=294128 RepID=A0A979FJ90_HYAAZ|nr:uncharacterized protein LOC108665911 [Hyalella azteca]